MWHAPDLLLCPRLLGRASWSEGERQGGVQPCHLLEECNHLGRCSKSDGGLSIIMYNGECMLQKVENFMFICKNQ